MSDPQHLPLIDEWYITNRNGEMRPPDHPGHRHVHGVLQRHPGALDVSDIRTPRVVHLDLAGKEVCTELVTYKLGKVAAKYSKQHKKELEHKGWTVCTHT
jgi:hypothetical protein